MFGSYLIGQDHIQNAHREFGVHSVMEKVVEPFAPVKTVTLALLVGLSCESFEAQHDPVALSYFQRHRRLKKKKSFPGLNVTRLRVGSSQYQHVFC